MTGSDRLKRAMERNDAMTARELHRRLQARSVRGSSRNMVQAYVAGSANPSLEFLGAAARELDVRLSWLATGEGMMTDAEQEMYEPTRREMDAKRAAAEWPAWTGALADALDRAGLLIVDVPLEVESLFAQVVRELVQAAPDPTEVSPEDVTSLARDVAWMVVLPLKAWGFERPSQGRWIQKYLTASLGALRLAVLEPDRAEGMKVYRSSLLPRLRELNSSS